jgi:hypothetical protein
MKPLVRPGPAGVKTVAKIFASRERLRRRHRPAHVRILFVGEAPPASGRFFYQRDSGLYRAVRKAFLDALPTLPADDFLDWFRALGCYLVDLCGRPVDHLSKKSRGKACRAGEPRLTRSLRQLRPEIVVALVRSIADNVKRAERRAAWSGVHIEVPYPGRWHQHRAAFLRTLKPLLRSNYG